MKLFSKDRSNNDVWQRVLAGDMLAYQTIVETNQSAVSAVAYSIIGDFPLSQDIAQETFWVAWTKRNKLRDASRLKSWLCGIARNLAQNWRKKNKGKARPATGETIAEPVSSVVDPLVQSIAEEEQAVVWSALQEIPENYREVLTLYYREEQSIADVALALDITVDSARQRLSRGRTMLRGRVSQLIEGVLVRSKPDSSFAAKVIAGLTAVGVAAKSGTAMASTATVVKTGVATGGSALLAKGAGAGLVAGGLGGLLGAIGGLGGAYLGIWLPAELASTESERQLMLHRGRTIFGLCVVQTLAILLLTIAFVVFRFETLYFVVTLLGLIIYFTVAVTVMSVRLARQCNELRKHVTSTNDPNQSNLAKFARDKIKPTIRQGKKWTSEMSFLGLPLIDIQFSDVHFTIPSGNTYKRSRAKGWIAFGDIATGFVAIGGIARGVFAFGGLAIGLLAVGGGAFGGLALGGGALGVYAIGGGAAGWNAAGGGALGIHGAAGGGAIAWHAAAGGGALAHDYAVGGGASAAEANTPLAREVVQRETLISGLDWWTRNRNLGTGIIIAVSLLGGMLAQIFYSKVKIPDVPEEKT